MLWERKVDIHVSNQQLNHSIVFKSEMTGEEILGGEALTETVKH